MKLLLRKSYYPTLKYKNISIDWLKLSNYHFPAFKKIYSVTKSFGDYFTQNIVEDVKAFSYLDQMTFSFALITLLPQQVSPSPENWRMLMKH